MISMMFFFRADNPVTEIEDFRMEVLILMPQLDTLDKEEYAPEEKQEAQAAYEERKAEFDLEAEIPEEEVMNSTCSVSPRGGKLADWAIYFACVNLARSANLPEGLYIFCQCFSLLYFLMVDFGDPVAQNLMDRSSPKFQDW